MIRTVYEVGMSIWLAIVSVWVLFEGQAALALALACVAYLLIARAYDRRKRLEVQKAKENEEVE